MYSRAIKNLNQGCWHVSVNNMCVFVVVVVVVVNFDNNAAKCISRQDRSILKKRCMVYNTLNKSDIIN